MPATLSPSLVSGAVKGSYVVVVKRRCTIQPPPEAGRNVGFFHFVVLPMARYAMSSNCSTSTRTRLLFLCRLLMMISSCIDRSLVGRMAPFGYALRINRGLPCSKSSVLPALCWSLSRSTRSRLTVWLPHWRGFVFWRWNGGSARRVPSIRLVQSFGQQYGGHVSARRALPSRSRSRWPASGSRAQQRARLQDHAELPETADRLLW